jgi:trimethylamine--corrinoid protein Co-methyltransferase
LSDSESFEQWVERGSKDASMRAFDRWNAMLKEYEAPPLDVAIDEELKAFMDKKKRSVPDAWH